jgi:phospholipid transport system substrate-binding protein
MRFLKWGILISFLLSVLLPSAIFAETPVDPIAMLTSISNDLFASLKKERPSVRTRQDTWIYRLVERVILPYVDIEGMSRSVVGRDIWYQASIDQQTSFSKAFTHVVVQTYSSAFDAYSDETIQFFPMREDIQNTKRILVHSQIMRTNAPPITLDYRLIRFNQHWKIYDLNIEGISLLQSFYSQFLAELSSGKTLMQLTQDLQMRYAKK